MANTGSEKQTNGYYSEDQIESYNKMQEAIHQYVMKYGGFIIGVDILSKSPGCWTINFNHDGEAMRNHQETAE